MHEMLPGLNGIGEERACTHHCLHLALLQKGYLRTQSPTQGRARDQGTRYRVGRNQQFLPKLYIYLKKSVDMYKLLIRTQ